MVAVAFIAAVFGSYWLGTVLAARRRFGRITLEAVRASGEVNPASVFRELREIRFAVHRRPDLLMFAICHVLVVAFIALVLVLLIRQSIE